MVVNDSVTREAISRKQERDLLKFIKEDKHFSRYYDGIYILFHTGLRISEFCGLTIQEVEFEEMCIKVDHQLQRASQMEYVIQQPKRESGIRYVPMTEEVASCFKRIIANRMAPKAEPMINGYVGFLFLDENDRHTFCSNMPKCGMKPKILQYIMGHVDISVTLNIYTHVKLDDAKNERLRVVNS